VIAVAVPTLAITALAVAALGLSVLTGLSAPMAVERLAVQVLGQKVLLRADLSAVPLSGRQRALVSVWEVLRDRLDAFGEETSLVRVVGSSQTRTDNTIGDLEVYVWHMTPTLTQVLTAPGRLEFKQQDSAGHWIPATGQLNGQTVALTSAYLVRGRQSVVTSAAGRPHVTFEFNSDGATLLQQISQHLLGQQLGMYLDGQQLAAPTVQAVLSSTGVITGLSLEQAQFVAAVLNDGELPVPVAIG
jgi:preprotein translocase subunit SecD